MQALKSIGVLVIAYFAIGTVVGVLDGGLHAVFTQSLPDQTSSRLPDSGWLLWHIGEVGLITLNSAYLAAFMVSQAEWLHISILGAWMVLVGLANYGLSAHQWPTWFSVSMIVVPVPAVLLGGYIRIRLKRAQDQKRQQEETHHLVRRAVLWGIGLAILLRAHDYQHDPMYRRHFSIRSVFWVVELPVLVGIGACLGYVVGRWRGARNMNVTAGPPMAPSA